MKGLRANGFSNGFLANPHTDLADCGTALHFVMQHVITPVHRQRERLVQWGGLHLCENSQLSCSELIGRCGLRTEKE